MKKLLQILKRMRRAWTIAKQYAQHRAAIKAKKNELLK